MSIKKFYYYLYYNIYCFFINISDDILNKFKPVLIISVLEVCLLMDFFLWYIILTKGGNDAIWPYFFIIIILIALFNSYIFLHNNKYKNYFAEFKKYNKRKKMIGGWATFILIILIITSLYYSFHQMGLVDWKKYK